MTDITQLQAIDVIESSGMEPATVALLKEKFIPFLEQAREWKQRASGLVVTDESQTREMKMAREARLALREIRINADKARKDLKADALAYGRAVQGVYNTIEKAIKPIEEHLLEQEQFVEIKRQKEREALHLEREQAINPYMEWLPDNFQLSLTNTPWADVSEEKFNMLLSNALSAKEAHKAEQARLEAERIAREKAEAEERERIRKENERLRAERAELEKQQAEERARMEAERRKAEEQARKEREAAEAKLAAERAERERMEAEARKKAEEERKRKEAEEEARRRAEAAPDKDKLLAFAAELTDIQVPSVKVDEAKRIAESIEKKLFDLALKIREEAERL